MSKERYIVIMAGGKGERFWPQSRLRRPKHLLPIVGDKPMLTQTVERLGSLVPVENIFVVTNEEQAEAVGEVCPNLPKENIVGEPVGRDTAAAVGLSTLLVKSRNPDASFAMLPADHVIHDSEGFQNILGAAFEAAENADTLVTVGINPTYPATGYGYIEKGDVTSTANGQSVYTVQGFKEKPAADVAEGYVRSGKFYWNAGMFIWRVPVIEGCFKEFTPKLWEALGSIEEGMAKGENLQELLNTYYPNLEKISIDYAIMEKARSVSVIQSAFDWDDVGEWPAVERHFPADESGNVSKGDVVCQDSEGNIVINEGGHVTAVIGVKDLIVVQTGDATLICPKSEAQSIKQLVKKLGAEERYSHLL